jgi:hypothetical protein
MRKTMQTVSLRFLSWAPRPGSGWQLLWQLVRLNSLVLTAEMLLAAASAILFYTPAYFLQRLVEYLEINPGREGRGWGWVYVIGLFVTNAAKALSRLLSLSSQHYLIEYYSVTGQLWSIATTVVQCRLRIQLNSSLFAKSLVRKDIVSSSPSQTTKIGDNESVPGTGPEKKEDGNDSFSSKAQVMTLMTTDVDRVSEFAWHIFSLVGRLL